MKLKKTLCVGLIAGMALASSIPIFADTEVPIVDTYVPYRPEIKIKVDGDYIETDVSPEIRADKTYVPISFIAQKLGASIRWESPKTIIEKDGVTLEFEIDKYNIIRNGVKYPQTTAAYIQEGRTMVPLRVVSEFLGCQVGYDNENKIVSITKETGAIEAPAIDISMFSLSPDGKWGIATETYYDTQLKVGYSGVVRQKKLTEVYLLNVETNDVKKIHNSQATYCLWLSDTNQLLIEYKLTSGYQRFYKLYDPTTDTTIELTQEEYNELVEEEYALQGWEKAW